MTRFYPLKVKNVFKDTADCTVIEFEVPAAQKEAFTYKQGQYLTLKALINGEDVRRNYSLCSSPLEEDRYAVGVKLVEGGKFSTYAHEVLKTGDTLEVMPPLGKFFTEINAQNAKHYVAFAAGSGITPIMSIMKTVLHAEPESQFTLFYGNQQVQSIMFKEEIEGLKNQFLDRLQVYHFLTRERLDAPLFNGRFSPHKMTEIFAKLLAPQAADEYFICGPEEMVFCIKEALGENGVAKEKVHFELFTTENSKYIKAARPQRKSSGITSTVVIVDGGKSFEFELEDGDTSILDGAMKQGADLPFACKGGVCCTCKAKLLEGKVDMDVNYALEHDEVEAGFILTCQAHPKTQKVVVDFDQAI